MKNKNIILMLFVFVLGLVSSQAKAVELDGHLLIGAGGVNVSDSDFQAAGTNQVYGQLQIEFGMAVYGPLEVYGMFGYGSSSRDYILDASDITITPYDAELGARYYYPLLSFLDVYAKMGLRYQYGGLRVGEDAGYGGDYTSDVLHGSANSFGGTAALGIAILFPRDAYMEVFGYDEDSFWSNSTAGVYFEFGGNLQSAHNFDELTPPEPESEKDRARQLEYSTVNFGSINLSGLYWRGGVIFYF